MWQVEPGLDEPLTLPAYLGEALSKNPGYIKLRKIRAAQNISKTVRGRPHSLRAAHQDGKYPVTHSHTRGLELDLSLFLNNFLGRLPPPKSDSPSFVFVGCVKEV